MLCILVAAWGQLYNIPESFNSSQFSLQTRDCVLDELRGMEEVFAGSELLELLWNCLYLLTGGHSREREVEGGEESKERER